MERDKEGSKGKKERKRKKKLDIPAKHTKFFGFSQK